MKAETFAYEIRAHHKRQCAIGEIPKRLLAFAGLRQQDIPRLRIAHSQRRCITAKHELTFEFVLPCKSGLNVLEFFRSCC